MTPNRTGVFTLLLLYSGVVTAADVVPHAQDHPPGPALSPEEAIRKMTVPEGFSVELVASEPEIVNPVAMTFDERGRVWITESLEYPRHEAGPGRDRVKVLEDTDGDGKADKFTVFAEGLNIPSGIAVGYGGVWVANAPDILFLQDTDGDGKADKQEVVVTGFGRFDTHELPNSLTWGPDGWLYGLNGVFNQSRVEQKGKVFEFTCALFRIHPRTREFQVFCEGTSNPWGVAFDGEGSAFVSACVIDHLWHLTESGYYQRQGGPYPPFTSIIGSIVKHKHQKAAYCGITYFDSDAYPDEYRRQLYMGNIHGGCINVDTLERDGSTYFARPRPDFLTANDAWFMPVAQKTGPDGCLYVLDWYDRYHCYQDAGRDPQGIDRLKGRLYRVRYKDTPRAAKFDLAKESDEQLIERLGSPNVYFRELAQRLLAERSSPEVKAAIEKRVLDNSVSRTARLHALWSLISSGALTSSFHHRLLDHEDSAFRAWAVRAVGNQRKIDWVMVPKLHALARDKSPEVRLQLAIAATKQQSLEPMELLLEVLANSEQDKLIPHIVWQNLHPLLEDHTDELLKLIEARDLKKSPALAAMMPRMIDRILSRKNPDPTPVAGLLKLLSSGPNANPVAAQKCLSLLAAKVASRELAGGKLAELKPLVADAVKSILDAGPQQPLYLDAALLAATWKDPTGLSAATQLYVAKDQPVPRRIQALQSLVAAQADSLRESVGATLSDHTLGTPELRGATLDALDRIDAPWVAELVLANYATLQPDVQPKAIVLLSSRVEWAHRLVDQVAVEKIPASALNLNQVRRLLALGDEPLAEKVRKHWGTVRTGRNPDREKVIGEIRNLVRRTSGDPLTGQAVFKKVCGQCHKIYGDGQEVGPDITSNGRNSFEQLLSNVLDPSLVIGAAYQARTVVTSDGRVLAGLLAEDNEQRIVLRQQGGKSEVIPRDEIEAIKVSELSLMPEDLEKQLKPQELVDLFAFLVLDKPPSDPSGKQLPGSREIPAHDTGDLAKFNQLLSEFAPGWTASAVSSEGQGIVAEHFGRSGVLRTHPLNRNRPTVLSKTIDVPKEKRTRLELSVSHDPRGDWQLVVMADGREVHNTVIGSESVENGWQTIGIDLSSWAGRSVKLELWNKADDWAWEFGYWGGIDVISE